MIEVMATRDSAATKQRILDAATAEFAEYGLAGARVDRIATRAEANKQLIYAYFGNKEELFDNALETNICLLLDTVPFTADDLPAYAAALFDFAVAHPQLVRLVRWHQLERPGVMNQLPETAASNTRKLDAIAAAQQRGKVSDAVARRPVAPAPAHADPRRRRDPHRLRERPRSPARDARRGRAATHLPHLISQRSAEIED